MQNVRDAKDLFNSTLFWDARDIDLDRHAAYVIARVLDFGDEKDLKKLREIYSDTQLIAVVKKSRGLLPITRRFWSVYFGIQEQKE